MYVVVLSIGLAFQTMVRNLLAPLKNVTLKRFDVGFVNKRRSLDTIIGRAAHICFLDQDSYMDMLTHVYRKTFA